MTDMTPHARKVRRSLLQRDLLGGVPAVGFVALLILAVVFVYVFGMIFMLVPIVIAFLVLRALTKKDPWLTEIVLDNILQKELFIP